MKITIPFKTPTINHLYWHRGNMKIMKKEAKELQEEISIIVKELGARKKYDHDISPNSLLKVSTSIFEDWFYQNGEVANKDVSNREKFLIDSVFKALGVDDRYIFEHTMKKVQSDEEKAIIEIEVINGIQYPETLA